MGIEPAPDSSTKIAFPELGGADSGAVSPTDPLAAFVATLNPEQRAALVRVLGATSDARRPTDGSSD